jgi:hypothetical protein
MQAGTDPWQAAGFLSTGVETLLRVYGHHHPDRQREATENISRRPQNVTRNRVMFALRSADFGTENSHKQELDGVNRFPPKAEVTSSNLVGRANLRRIHDFVRSAAPGHSGRNSLSYSGWCSAVFGVLIGSLLFDCATPRHPRRSPLRTVSMRSEPSPCRRS